MSELTMLKRQHCNGTPTNSYTHCRLALALVADLAMGHKVEPEILWWDGALLPSGTSGARFQFSLWIDAPIAGIAINPDAAKHAQDGGQVMKEIWVVLDEEGKLIYCAGWAAACHEHINDAINEFGLEEAGKWRVVKYVQGGKP